MHTGVRRLPADGAELTAARESGSHQRFLKSLAPLSDSFGSAFSFDFVRNPSRPKKPLVRDTRGSWKLRNPESGASSPVEANGGKVLDMRLQGQQEELSRMQQEQDKLREELATQKVQLFVCL